MKAILERLFEKRFLSMQESKSLLKGIAAGSYPPAQTAALLSVFRMRGPAVEELEGFRAAMMDLCIAVDLSDFRPVDLVGTGGDGKNSFNISTLAALITAGAGQPVAKHGNYGVSSVCGASNVLEVLGMSFPKSAAEARRDIERTGFCYLHAPFFHPAMKAIAPIRKELGFRTFFNILGPLVNPASPPAQLIGVAAYGLLRLYSYLLQRLEVSYTIVHSLDGYDEISLTGPCQIEARGEERLLEPGDLGFDAVRPEDLAGGSTPQESAAIFLKILEGEGTRAQNQAVLVNAAAAIHCAKQDKSWEDAAAMAKESLESGRALRVLKDLTEGVR